MGILTVWAPSVKTLQAVIQGQRRELERLPRGWWRLQDQLIKHGLDYAFIIDSELELPDPRSACQPAGVKGPSRFVDHALFHWTDQTWQPPPLSSAVIYELHVGTFSPSGTFAGVIERLDHLVDLGITHISLMPVNTFPGQHGWGYDGVDLYAVHEAYGGTEGLKALVDACHARGLAVIQDVVYNHVGAGGEFLDHFGPYFTSRYTSPWGRTFNLDGPGSTTVRRFICDNACMWLSDYHMDGLRLDAVHAIIDTSAVHLLEQLAGEVKRLEAHLGRHLVVIPESDLNDPRLLRPRESGGYDLDAQWSDDFHHALHALITGERNGYYSDFGKLWHMAQALKQAYVYNGRYSMHRGRRHGRPIGELSGHRFLGYLQTHDQVGNRAIGERISHLTRLNRVKIGAALVFTAPFVPMLFQGEEWAASTPFFYFTDHPDPGFGQMVKNGRRNEFAAFGWRPEDIPDPQDLGTFLRSKLKWDELTQEPHHSMLDWYRRLIRLRRNWPSLRDGRLNAVEVVYDETAGTLVMHRAPMSVLCNFGPDPFSYNLSGSTSGNILMSSEPVRQDGTNLVIPPESVAILGP